jgi:predicted outer membrane repeat protein
MKAPPFCVAGLLSIILELALPTRAATLTVTNTADSGAGTLRNVVASTSPGDFIVFSPALSGQTITLTSGQLVINKDVIVDASMLPGGVTINGHHNSRIFQFNAGTSVLIGLTLTNGYESGQEGGALSVTNGSTLILTNCMFAGNSVTNSYDGGGGGGIYNDGTLSVDQSTFSGNSINANFYKAWGGGIYNDSSGTLIVNQCTFFGNSANGSGVGGAGGGICNIGTLTVNQCTFFGNSASGYDSTYDEGPMGGGIFNIATLTVNQCTIFGNSTSGSTGDGGGIFCIYTTISLYNSIVAGNTSLNGGGDITVSEAELNCSGTNIALNIDGNYGTLSGPRPLHAAPALAPLGYYGGSTQTMPPLLGSPAIDAASNSATNQFATDQRGFPRLVGAGVDIGAVEFQYGRIVTNAADSGENTLRADVAYEPSGSTITFASNLSGLPIVLTSGEIVLSTNLVIDGRVPGGIQISGNNASRVFHISGGTVSLFGLTLTSGNADPGGAIYSAAGTHLTMLDCTLTGNNGLEGGALLNDGALSLYQCTFVNNGFGYGGAFQARSPASVVQCTFANNTASYGGGIYVKTLGLHIWNTIVDGNSANSGNDVTIESGYTLFYDGPNVISDVAIGNGSAALGPAPIGAPAQLAPLGNYGGPTMTMPPLPGSPVVDAGLDDILNTFSTDQRGSGFPRLVGAHVDIGAVEGVYVANYTGPGNLNNPVWQGNGAFQFGFTNYPDMNISFSVWASTNLAMPFNLWSPLGAPVESPAGSGQFQFTDSQATNSPQRFYRVSSP